MEQLPFLSQEEFNEACDELCMRWQQWKTMILDTRQHYLVTEGRRQYITLRRPLTAVTSATTDDVIIAEMQQDEDDEAAIHHTGYVAQRGSVDYHILLSPTYSVPVLYFNLQDMPSDGSTGIDAAYQYLIPERWKSGLSNMGILGGISMTNHPVTDLPCFFIHPCNIAEAMKELIGSRKVSGLEYMQLWLGLVGGCVGLYLPKELALDHRNGY